jgi:nitrogen regulatory protein PII
MYKPLSIEQAYPSATNEAIRKAQSMLADYNRNKELKIIIMKQLLVLAAVLLTFVACTGNGKQTEASDEAVQTSGISENAFVELDSLLAVADREVDKTITVVGYVTHTCKHSGKRCFIVGESQAASMRVEAKGEIGGFNRELVGSKLAINGILKERRLSQEYIAAMEKDVNLKKQEDGAAESCAAELSNIADMRKWMKDHNKDYYVIYYMDGLSFETLD